MYHCLVRVNTAIWHKCKTALISKKVSKCRLQRNNTCMLYSKNGPQTLTWVKKHCPACDASFYSGWWAPKRGLGGGDGSVFYFTYEKKTSTTVFTSTKYSSFDVEFMVECDYTFLHLNGSFTGICNVFNSKHRTLLVADGRQDYIDYLDANSHGRWLEPDVLGNAWYKWTLYNYLLQSGPTVIDSLDFGVNGPQLDSVLLQCLPSYEADFESRFGQHKCNVFGCNDCWVRDGHMKNRRFICATRFTNFVAVEGFPNGGYFKGCLRKPEPNSLFCAKC
jgi:hypothetical protein